MKKVWYSFFITLSLLGSTSYAHRVQPLYRDDTLRTYLSIPFRLITEDSSQLKVTKVKIEKGSSTCGSLIDPYIKENFFIKCLEEGNVTFNVSFTANGAAKSIVYGPFYITKIAAAGSVMDNSAGGNKSKEYSEGEVLYYENYGGKTYVNGSRIMACVECHQAPINKKGLTESSLRNSLSSVTRMANESINKKQVLTDSQIKSLVIFINSQK